MELERLSALEIGTLVSKREISPIEVISYFEERIGSRNKSINAFVYTKFDYAKAEAKRLEKRILNGESIGPFAGVPFALKDFLPSKKGWPNSHGGVFSLIKEDPENSAFCTALENLGGIAVGKTNAPAFGFRGTCDNKLYGATKNPFNTDYNSGGSSGGSAAAVADGLVPIAEGSDGGGSIRIPAAWCSLFGFKPSVGTVPDIKRPDAWSATHPYCVNGGLTKTVDDTAVLLSEMARFDPLDPMSIKSEKTDYLKGLNRSLKGLKIGVTADFGIYPVEREIAKRVIDTARVFESAGGVVDNVDFSIPYTLNELSKMWCRSISIDTSIELELMKANGLDLIKDHSDELPREFINWNKKAFSSTVLDYYDFNVMRTKLLDETEKAFSKFDIIISPTTACLPVPNSDDKNTLGPENINGEKVERLIGFCETFIFNFTGNPAASVPIGLSKSGLPIGMQIIGRRFCDADVLAVSKAFEEIRPWRDLYDIPQKRKI